MRLPNMAKPAAAETANGPREKGSAGGAISTLHKESASCGQCARDIAVALGGGRATGGGNYSAPCPLPSHGQGRGDRNHSLSLRDGDRRLLVRCHAGCDSHELLAELRRRALLDGGDPVTHHHHVGNGGGNQRDLADYARQLWDEAKAITGTLAEDYLRKHRGISIELPWSLRFHPRIKVPRQRLWLAAMVAAVSDEDHEIRAAQVTWLEPTGTKARIEHPRRTFGRLGSGAVRLGRPGELIGLAEGIETALSVTELFGVTCWAVLGAERLGRVKIPHHTASVHIYADPDAVTLADRAARLLSARVCVPPHGNSDWNDVLRQGAK